MHVAALHLRDFRNYGSLDIELAPGANAFIGRNGQGKTSLVEAIGYLGHLGSHRVSTDAALVRAGATHAVIRATLVHARRSIEVQLQINAQGANRAQVQGTRVRPRDLLAYCSTVLFAPEDLSLVRGDPATRRAFVDGLVETMSPRMHGVHADYERVVRQRTTLLKQARSGRIDLDTARATLSVWNERLIELGTEVMVERASMVARLAPYVARAYASIVGADHGPSLHLADSLGAGREADTRDAIEPAFRTALEAAAGQELERAVTLVGPHRDDLVLSLNGMPARGYASHGESWSLALSLKLASAELVRAESPGGDPILVLDDVFAELDEGRRSRLSEAVAGFEQVLITSAVESDVPAELGEHRTYIAAGAVVSSLRPSA